MLLVSITPAGLALKEKAAGIPQAIRAASRLTDSEAETLTALVNKLLASSRDD